MTVGNLARVGSCGCQVKRRRAEASAKSLVDMTGRDFGTFKVTDKIVRTKDDGRRESMWVCQCACGNTFESLGTTIRRGSVTSCGCVRAAKFAHAKSRKVRLEGVDVSVHDLAATTGIAATTLRARLRRGMPDAATRPLRRKAAQ